MLFRLLGSCPVVLLLGFSAIRVFGCLFVGLLGRCVGPLGCFVGCLLCCCVVLLLICCACRLMCSLVLFCWVVVLLGFCAVGLFSCLVVVLMGCCSNDMSANKI